MVLFLFILFSIPARSLWYRRFNTVYVQNPEETPEEQRTKIEDMLTFQIDRINHAMEFHELDFRFVQGDIFVKSSEYWGESGHKCGDVRKKFCTPWTDELGRENEHTVDVWMCIMGDGIGCAGVGGGNTLAVQYSPFLNENKVVVNHELGHCLGCGDKTKLCQPDFDQFAQVTGKRYQTSMGGGAKCDYDLYGGLERLRLPYYEDATKQYCEDGVCLTLSDEKHECMTSIKKKWEGIVKDLKPFCGSNLATGINAAQFKYCVVAEDTKCVGSTVFGLDGDFVPSVRNDCVELMEEDESLCPSETWFYKYRASKEKCNCCDLAHTDPNFETDNAKYDLFQLDIKSETSGDEGTTDYTQSYSITYVQGSSHDLFLYALAIVGLFGIVKYVAGICKVTKYMHIPEAQIAEI